LKEQNAMTTFPLTNPPAKTENRVRLNNPKILIWAREELGLKVDSVAEHFKKPVSIIEGWENGTEFPTFRQLSEMANYYKRPIAVFFLPNLPPKFSKPIDHRTLFGSLHGQYSRETLLAYRQVAEMLHQARELFSDLDASVKFSLPHWSMNKDPEIKAIEIRSLLGISGQLYAA
jgi:transcriptional regulator with XRE-family HTH domain